MLLSLQTRMDTKRTCVCSQDETRFHNDSLTEFKVKKMMFLGATCWLKCPCYQWVVQSEFFFRQGLPTPEHQFLTFSLVCI